MKSALGALILWPALIVFSWSAPAAEVSKENLKALKDTIAKYQKSGLVRMKIEKKVISELLGTERNYSGNLALAPNRFRLETKEPEKSLIVYDGTYLWTVQYPLTEEGKIQVAKAKLDKKNQNQVLLTDLLLGQSVLKQFDFLSEEKQEDTLRLSAKPKTKDEAISDLKISLDSKTKQIKEISYTDELGNRTIMTFSDHQLEKKPQAKLFRYVPEKGAEVSDL